MTSTRKSASDTSSSRDAQTSPERSQTKSKSKSKSPKEANPDWQRWKANPDASISELCAFVVDGGHLADFARGKNFPYTTLLLWINSDTERAELYARAREDRSDKLADEIVSISDEAEVKVKLDPTTGEEIEVVLDATAVQRNRLRVDARKWVAAKLKPRVYGDKVQVDANVNVRELTDDQLAARLARFGVQVAPAKASDDTSA